MVSPQRSSANAALRDTDPLPPMVPPRSHPRRWRSIGSLKKRASSRFRSYRTVAACSPPYSLRSVRRLRAQRMADDATHHRTTTNQVNLPPEEAARAIGANPGGLRQLYKGTDLSKLVAQRGTVLPIQGDGLVTPPWTSTKLQTGGLRQLYKGMDLFRLIAQQSSSARPSSG